MKAAWSEGPGNRLSGCNDFGLHVLILHNDPAEGQSMAASLAAIGHRVSVGLDQITAGQAKFGAPPDVVLLGTPLPYRKHSTLAELFDQPPWAKRPFFIALVDPDTDQADLHSSDVDIDLFLTIPLDNEFLQRVLDRFSQVITPSGQLHQNWPAPDRALRSSVCQV